MGMWGLDVPYLYNVWHYETLLHQINRAYTVRPSGKRIRPYSAPLYMHKLNMTIQVKSRSSHSSRRDRCQSAEQYQHQGSWIEACETNVDQCFMVVHVGTDGSLMFLVLYHG